MTTLPSPVGVRWAGQRDRLFAALEELLGRVVETTPVVLVLEDLQWAGTATLDLLTCLVARARGPVAPIVMTCRNDQGPVPDVVLSFLAHIRRMPWVAEVQLAALPRQDVAIQSRTCSASTLRAVRQRASS